MTFEFDIPDIIVAGLDEYLAQQYGEAIPDENGNRVLPKRYPGGVDDFLREVIGAAIHNTPAVMKDPAIRAHQQAIIAQTNEMLDLIRPQVRRRGAGPPTS